LFFSTVGGVGAARAIIVIGCHAGGEVGNVVVAGVDPPPGDSVRAQMEALRDDDSLRRFLLREPRGSVATHANVIVPATRADCDYGYVIMEPTEYPLMSGSNTICVATVLLETGLVELHEPETVLRLEAPAGIVEARCACRDGRVESVELTNVPSYATHLEASLEVDGVGTIAVDVAFGGMWYAIADAAALGFELVAHEARDLCTAGEAIRVAAREQLSSDVSIVQLAGQWQGVGAVSRNAVVVAPGRLDRSPTGTGLSARMAVLHARGLMCVGDSMAHASVLGSTFEGRIVAEAGGGIVPAIRGSAFITGRSELYLDDRDPFPEGYLLNDTWPGDDVQH
jgi:proline racemase